MPCRINQYFLLFLLQTEDNAYIGFESKASVPENTELQNGEAPETSLLAADNALVDENNQVHR